MFSAFSLNNNTPSVSKEASSSTSGIDIYFSDSRPDSCSAFVALRKKNSCSADKVPMTKDTPLQLSRLKSHA